MEVKLLHATPLEVLVTAIRECYESHEKSDSHYGGPINDPYKDSFGKPFNNYYLGEKDKALIQNVIKNNHTSTLEHIAFNFRFTGFSRAVLQELSRHRIASESVKSSRFTLKELKEEEPFIHKSWEALKERASKYLVFTGTDVVDVSSIWALENLRKLVAAGLPNDQTKYCMPDAYKTNCIFSINARSLRNFLQLRTSPKALWEFQELAKKVFEAVPTDYRFLVEDCVHVK